MCLAFVSFTLPFMMEQSVTETKKDITHCERRTCDLSGIVIIDPERLYWLRAGIRTCA